MEHFDVLIVGAGPSGIGAGVPLKTRCRALQCDLLALRCGRLDDGARVFANPLPAPVAVAA